MFPDQKLGTLRYVLDDALQFDGAANFVELFQRQNAALVLDLDVGHCASKQIISPPQLLPFPCFWEFFFFF